MNRKQIIVALEEMATLLELLGANPFKSRAFTNGARALETLDEELETLVREKRLIETPGIGKSIAEIVSSFVTEGQNDEYEKLRASVPAGLRDVLAIPGLGPKKVRVFWQKLDITSLDALENAAAAGDLRELPGFGTRTEEKILEGIEYHRRFHGRFLWSVARRVAATFEELLASHPRVEQFSVAGSLRRRLETVHDVDLLVAVAEEHRGEVMDAFVNSPQVMRVLGRGSTKSSVVTDQGMQVDLRAVSNIEFPFALHHFTGSREHNTALRGRAKARGLKMSEWGVFSGDERLPARDEGAVFALLDLPWIPPELRENGGEIEAADSGDLPSLVTDDDLRGVLHVHTTASDGRDRAEAMVSAAQRAGYRYLGISDHSQSAIYANGLDAKRVREQREELAALQKGLRGLTILHGIESDILADGSLDYDDETLAEFDFVIAAVHSQFSMDRERMTKRILDAIQHPAVSILGHPTGRRLLARDGYDVDLDAIFEMAGRLGVAIEINASPQRLDLDWRHCRHALSHGVVFSIGPDAHRVEAFGDVAFGIGVARKGWLTAKDVLNCRSISQVRAFFKRRRAQPLG